MDESESGVEIVDVRKCLSKNIKSSYGTVDRY